MFQKPMSSAMITTMLGFCGCAVAGVAITDAADTRRPSPRFVIVRIVVPLMA